MATKFMGTEFIWFNGIVEDRNDPLKLGRCRVRCFGWHTEDKAKLPTEMLPWAIPLQPITSAAMNGIGSSPLGPVEGTLVMGFFMDGNDAQELVYMGTIGGIPSRQIDASKGFNDPLGNYPRELGQPDTNKLARTEDIAKTIVATKNNARTENVQSVDQTWSEPLSSYNTQHPFNHVIESESGHVFEIDDSPDSERIHMHHKSGTYTEIDRNGSRIQRIRGESYEIIDHNGHIYIKGNARVTVDGDVDLQINNAARLKVLGDVDLTAQNDLNISVSGEFNLAAESINMKADSITHEADSFDVSTGAAKIDNITSNNPGLTLHPIPGGAAGKTGLSAPASAASTTVPDLVGLHTISRADVSAIDNDDIETGLPADLQQQLIDEGWTDAISDDFTQQEEKQPGKNTVEPTFQNCIDLDNAQVIPETFQLSTNFTLGMLTTKTAVCRYRLRGNAGLSQGQIACNLQHVAKNVLEPIKAKYSDMLITCGFRSKGGVSFHERGLAVDLNFTSRKTRKEYFDIANDIVTFIAYDKVILEYKSWGNSLPWIHIQIQGQHGYKGSNRKQVFTFNNLKNVGSGKLLLLG